MPDALPTVVDVERFRGARVLEVGPKYGVHALWIDRELRPSELVFSDFAVGHAAARAVGRQLERPHRFVYGDLRKAEELLELEPFDLVFFLGVLYHSAHHLPLLGMLNRVTRLGGAMLLETTVDPRPTRSSGSAGRPEREGEGRADGPGGARRARLDGWRKVTRFTDYRPGSSEALFLCEKTDELAEDDAALSAVVTPHRPRSVRVSELEPHPAVRVRTDAREAAARHVAAPTCAGANALVAVKRAGSGHLGSSFSAMDIVVSCSSRS